MYLVPELVYGSLRLELPQRLRAHRMWNMKVEFMPVCCCPQLIRCC